MPWGRATQPAGSSGDHVLFPLPSPIPHPPACFYFSFMLAFSTHWTEQAPVSCSTIGFVFIRETVSDLSDFTAEQERAAGDSSCVNRAWMRLAWITLGTVVDGLPVGSQRWHSPICNHVGTSSQPCHTAACDLKARLSSFSVLAFFILTQACTVGHLNRFPLWSDLCRGLY